MPVTAQSNSVSKSSAWAGRIISVLVVLFLLFDSAIKVLKLAAAVDGTFRLGIRQVSFVPWELFY